MHNSIIIIYISISYIYIYHNFIIYSSTIPQLLLPVPDNLTGSSWICVEWPHEAPVPAMSAQAPAWTPKTLKTSRKEVGRIGKPWLEMLKHDETGVAPRWIRRKTALQWPCGAWSMKNIAWQPNSTVSRCFLQICTVELSPLPLEHQMRRAPMLICRAKSTSPTHLAAITCWPRTSYVL